MSFERICGQVGEPNKKFIPDKGNVRLLSVTEKQYYDMKILVGNKTKTEEILGVERMIII